MPKNTTLNHVIVVDTHEQLPYAFARWHPVIERKALKTGDYSLQHFEDRIAVERKSLSDFYGSVGRSRERFFRELARMSLVPYKLIVVETCPSSLFKPDKHRYTRLTKAHVLGAICKIMAHHHVPLFLCYNRTICEEVVYQFLRHSLRSLTR